jgi:hypothetical protein
MIVSKGAQPTIVWTYELARSHNARQWHLLRHRDDTSCGITPTTDWVYGASPTTSQFKLCRRCFGAHLHPIVVVHGVLVTGE